MSAAPKPEGLNGGTRRFSQEDIFWIASRFQLNGLGEIEEFGQKGNINLHTYLVKDADGKEHLLQRINSDVFRKPHRVMRAMRAWIQAQEDYLASGKAPSWTIWQPISLVPSMSGDASFDLSDRQGVSVWRMMVKIPDSVSHKSLAELPTRAEQMRAAEEMGRGLALSADFVSQMPLDGLKSSLPGYRDTDGYYRQLHSVLAGNTYLEQCEKDLPLDDEVRESTESLYILAISEAAAQARREDPELRPFIQLAVEAQQDGMALCRAAAEGVIRTVAIHGDTKIENFLFCDDSGRVRCLVDLDTIMPYTWLADWGDMLRSLVNVAGEKERDLSKVQVDREVYEAVARGFLSSVSEATEEEIGMMARSVEAIALELGIRFLADYLRGDNYFMLGDTDPADLNKVRAMVQLRLYQELRSSREWAEAMIQELRREAAPV